MVRTERSAFADLFVSAWSSLETLQGALDARAVELHLRRRCPATGTTVAEALLAEQPRLQPVPAVHKPFDCVVARRVSRDCLVSFEGRRYSVPSRGSAARSRSGAPPSTSSVFAESREVARHPAAYRPALLLEPAHYEGPATPTIHAPTPLGRRARLQLAGLAAPAAVARPLTAYVALVDQTLRAEACR